MRLSFRRAVAYAVLVVAVFGAGYFAAGEKPRNHLILAHAGADCRPADYGKFRMVDGMPQVCRP